MHNIKHTMCIKHVHLKTVLCFSPKNLPPESLFSFELTATFYPSNCLLGRSVLFASDSVFQSLKIWQ